MGDRDRNEICSFCGDESMAVSARIYIGYVGETSYITQVRL